MINQNLRVLDLIKFCKKEAELECFELYLYSVYLHHSFQCCNFYDVELYAHFSLYLENKAALFSKQIYIGGLIWLIIS